MRAWGIASLVAAVALAAGCGGHDVGPHDGGARSDGGVPTDGGCDPSAGPTCATPDGGGPGDGSAGDGGGPGDGGAPDDGGGIVPQRACGARFRYHGAAPAAVTVAGDFNAWDATANPLAGPDTHGDWTVTLPLTAGAHAYKFVTFDPADRPTWLLDAANPYTRFVGGIENSVVEVDDCQSPILTFTALSKTAAGVLHAEVQYRDGAGAAGLDRAAILVTLDGNRAAARVDGSGHITVDASGLAKTKHRLVVTAADRAGRPAAPLHIPFWIEDAPFDFRDGLLYFAFTDRFREGNPANTVVAPGVDPRANYEGGDFAGIAAAIDEGYFDALGVRTLWISPPNRNPDGGEPGSGGHTYTGYHGYWPVDGRATQPRFGTLAELQAMVRRAHAHGMRVIVDAVLNHVHQQHPYFVQHQRDGWFTPLTVNNQSCVCNDAAGCGNWGSARESCWFTPYLPDIDYTNWDALVAMVDDALFWAREADVDGFRVDAVKHFKLAATRRLRGKLHDLFEHDGPLFYLVGETFDGDRALIDSFIGPTALHAQFDFPIYFSVIDTLATYSQSLRALEAATAASDRAFGDAPMSPFFGNHDVARFLSFAAGQLTADPQAQAWNDVQRPVAPTTEDAYFKQRLALTFVAGSPGVPLVYYGDEYGQAGAGDPDNRRFMKWSGHSPFERATLDTTRKLGAARRELTALRRGLRRTLWIDDDLYVFARVAGNDVALVVLNRSFGTTNTTRVPVPPDLALRDGTVLRDRLGGPSVTVTNHQIPLRIGPHASAVLAP
jgi:glycosidase